MSKLGRPVSNIIRIPTTVALQPQYIATLERMCHDPFFQKRKHGLRNEILEMALSEFFERNKITFSGDQNGPA